jgi:hypothetical protein
MSPGNQGVDLEKKGLGVESNVCSRAISGVKAKATQDRRVLGVRKISLSTCLVLTLEQFFLRACFVLLFS